VPRTSTFKSGPVPVEDAGTFQLHRFTPDAGVKLYSAGVSNLDGSVPANLYIQLVDHTTGGTLYSNSVDFEEGNPLNTFSVSGDDVEARIINQSGTVVDCHAFIDLEVTTLAATIPVTDSGVGSETFFGSSSIKEKDTGVGSGVFYGESLAKKEDIGAGQELIGFPLKEFTDSATSKELVGFKLKQLRDKGVGSGKFAVIQSAFDEATGIEKYYSKAQIPVKDIGSGKELVGFPLKQFEDIGSGKGIIGFKLKQLKDKGTGSETLTELRALVKKKETAMGVSLVGFPHKQFKDTGSGLEQYYSKAQIKETDVGSGIDLVAFPLKEFKDLATGKELVNYPLKEFTDSASGTEAVFAPIQIVKDTATGEDYVLTIEIPKHALKSQDYYEKIIRLLEINDMGR